MIIRGCEVFSAKEAIRDVSDAAKVCMDILTRQMKVGCLGTQVICGGFGLDVTELVRAYPGPMNTVEDLLLEADWKLQWIEVEPNRILWHLTAMPV